MAEYLKISNSNSTVIIDDQWRIPSLLWRGSIMPSVASGAQPVNPRWLKWWWSYTSELTTSYAPTLRALGFNYDDNQQNEEIIRAGLMIFGRPVGHNQAFTVECRLLKDANGYRLSVLGKTMSTGLMCEFALYAINLNLMPSKFGLHIYNAQGGLVFDALKGGLQNIGIVEGSVNLNSAIARTYNINIPEGLDSNNVFMSFRSPNPYAAGYTISSSGVSVGDTCFTGKMTVTASNLKVELVRLKTPGKSISYSSGGYFENVVYVPQPPGNYM